MKWGGKMYRLLFIAKNNLKKKKSDVIVLAFLTMLAAALLYISISAITNTGNVLDKVYEEANGADLLFITPSKDKEKLAEILSSQEEVVDWEITPCLLVEGVKYHGVGEEEHEMVFLLGTMEESRNIQRYFIKDEGEKKENSILLPYYFKAGFSYETGDKIYLTLGKREYEFEVMGFIEDNLFSTPTNISAYRCYVGEKYISEIKEREKGFFDEGYYEYKVKLREGESSQKFDEKVSAIITKEISDIAQYNNLGLNWEAMKGGAAIMSNISMGIIMVFGLLLNIIAIIIIRFSIRNFIEENLENIGILQAAGYTSGELKGAGMIEMACVAFGGTMVGTAAGYLCSGVVGKLQAMLIGLSCKMEFDKRAAVTTFGVIIFMVLIVTFFTIRIYSKITVLNALRGGICTHNFRRNYFPLEKSRFSLQAVLGAKSIFGEKAKSITVCFIVMILSFACCAGFSLYENFSANRDNLLKLVGIETGTAIVGGENLDLIGEEIISWEEVEKVGYYDNGSTKITKGNKNITLTCDFWKEPEELVNAMILEGRMPKYDNEIVLTAGVSELLEAKVGDVVYVEGSGEIKDYIVSGIDQKMNNMGRKALMNFEGAQRLNGQSNIYNLYVFANEGTTYESIESRLLEKYNNITLIDSEKMVESMISSITMAMELICVLFICITVFVVCMVVMLLIKTKVVRERKNYGIYKAFGFTTKQLMLQTVLANLPLIVMGAMIGIIASVYWMEAFVVNCLSFAGIKSCSMIVNPIWLFSTFFGITVTAFVTAVCCSRKIRKIEPAKMLMSE